MRNPSFIHWPTVWSSAVRFRVEVDGKMWGFDSSLLDPSVQAKPSSRSGTSKAVV